MLDDTPVFSALPENKPIPKVTVKAADTRPRCWHCGLLLQGSHYQLRANYHNQCIGRSLAAKQTNDWGTDDELQAEPNPDQQFIEYLDRIMNPKTVKEDVKQPKAL